MEDGTAEVIGFGGARGGSKSHAVRACNLIRRMQYPGTRSLIFRKTLDELRDNHLQPYFDTWPMLRAWYKVQEKTLHFPNGSTTVFRSGEESDDLKKFQGASYDDIFIDEATHHVQEDIEWMRTTLRTTKPDIKPRLVLTMNPGGIGHSYIKRIFLDRNFQGNERAGDYVFLGAKLQDNVEWCRRELEVDGYTAGDYYSWTDDERLQYAIERSQYGRNLDSLPRTRREAQLLGSWSSFEGKYFDCFNYDTNVVNHVRFRRESWWPTWISMDWGFRDRSVVLWHTINEDKVVTTYRELSFNGKTPQEVGHLIAESTPPSEKPEAFYLGPDAFGRRVSERTIALEIGEVMHSYGLPQPQKADDERISGWQLLYEGLWKQTWQITNTCRDLIESLPLMVYDDKRKEDIADNPNDHSPDAARYGLLTHLRTPSIPIDEVLRRRITTTDPTQCHLQYLAATEKVRNQYKPLRFRRAR